MNNDLEDPVLTVPVFPANRNFAGLDGMINCIEAKGNGIVRIGIPLEFFFNIPVSDAGENIDNPWTSVLTLIL